MTWGNNSVFQILIIQGSQAVTGLFLYNGLGAPGNPPQFAAVASTVTTDPFGNAITSSKILIQGNVITESGGIFRTAATAPLIQLDGPHNAVLIYDAAGHLTQTMAPVQTNDGLGDTVYAGIVNYNTALSAVVQMLGGTFNFGSPAQIGLTGSKQPGSVGLTAVTEGTAEISTGLNGATDTAATFLLWSKNAGAAGYPFAQLQTVLELSPQSTPAQQGDTILYDDNNDAFPRYRCGTVSSGDTNVYGYGVVQRGTTAAFGVGTSMGTIAPASGPALSATVAAKQYYIRGRLSCTMGTNAGQILLQIAGPAITSMEVGYWKAQNNPGGATLFSATQTAISTATNPFTVNEGALNGFTIFYEGTVIFSASGTISVQAQRQNAANPVQINANSTMILTPQ